MTSSSVLALDAVLSKVGMNGHVSKCSYPCSLRADVVLACDIIIQVKPKKKEKKERVSCRTMLLI
jgi:hypothetical protein